MGTCSLFQHVGKFGTFWLLLIPALATSLGQPPRPYPLRRERPA